jgi:hypothetical protein
MIDNTAKSKSNAKVAMTKRRFIVFLTDFGAIKK